MIKKWLRYLNDWAFSNLPSSSKIKIYRKKYEGNRLQAHKFLLKEFLFKKRETEKNDFFVSYEEPSAIFNHVSVVKNLMQYDVISFDIFDTILLRNVEKPTDIFKLMEKKLDTQGFAKQRQQAEYLSRRKKYKFQHTFEVNLPEIYEMLSLLPNHHRKELAALELMIEKENCRINPVMRTIIEELRTAGKTVIALSDMYLSGEQIRKLLETDEFSFEESIYVSSELGTSKSVGDLFDKVLGAEKYKKLKVVHIGDNFHSDILMSGKSGIPSLHYVR